MKTTKSITIDGVSLDEWGALPSEQWKELVFTKKPIVFQMGSSSILGQFTLEDARMQIELGHIDGGGEGVLLVIWNLAEEIAHAWGLCEVEWILHAVNCAKPNLKLRRVLIRKGFEVKSYQDKGEVYYFLKTYS